MALPQGILMLLELCHGRGRGAMDWSESKVSSWFLGFVAALSLKKIKPQLYIYYIT
jgi:hypothetical protein